MTDTAEIESSWVQHYNDVFFVYRFPRSDSFFFSISRFADPLYSFTLIIPLAAGMHTVLATDMMMVSVMAEWSNTLLKW